MEKYSPLMPFAFTSSTSEKIALNTTPRNRKIIDENAQSMYHTRGNGPKSKGPNLSVAPSLKRKMGASFNEKDDIKRRDLLEDLDSDPTFVDESDDNKEILTTTEHIQFDDGNNTLDTDTDNDAQNFPKKKHFTLPSSPTSGPQVDQSYSFNFSVPVSPAANFPSESQHSDFDIEFQEQQPVLITSQSKKFTVHELSSETDFGIDSFNRYRNPFQNCPSTDGNTESEDYRKQIRRLENTAHEKIMHAFENMDSCIDLQGLALTEIPEDIKDLDDLVIFSSKSNPVVYQLYLTDNRLRYLSHPLFAFTKLNVLGLRKNKLFEIPPLISKLENLTDLSIGTNRLEFLPQQVLQLPKLEFLRAWPNPFLPIPKDAIERKPKPADSTKYKTHFSPIRWRSSTHRSLPTLKTLCLSKIARYDVTYQETKVWKRHTPKVLHGLIASAITKSQFQETCSECDTIAVEPVAEAYEWWYYLQNKNLPIKKQFCSGICADKWLSESMSEI